MAASRRYVAMTAAKAARMGLNPSRKYGYVVQVIPPIVTYSEGQDIEGVGWHPMPRRKNVQHIACWCKRKDVAVGTSLRLNMAQIPVQD